MTSSPGRTTPEAIVPAKPRKSRSGRITYCTGKRKSIRFRSDGDVHGLEESSSVSPAYQRHAARWVDDVVALAARRSE